MNAPNALAQALHDIAGIEIVEASNPSEKQLRILSRLKVNAKRYTWHDVIKRLLSTQQEANWKVDISQYYMVRGIDLIWAWRIIISSEDLKRSCDEIATLVIKTPPAPNKMLMTAQMNASPDRIRASRGSATPLKAG